MPIAPMPIDTKKILGHKEEIFNSTKADVANA